LSTPVCLEHLNVRLEHPNVCLEHLNVLLDAGEAPVHLRNILLNAGETPVHLLDGCHQLTDQAGERKEFIAQQLAAQCLLPFGHRPKDLEQVTKVVHGKCHCQGYYII
jgi:hypothetical protein